MRRILFVILLGIALQGLGGVALIAWWTREEGGSAGRPFDEPAASAVPRTPHVRASTALAELAPAADRASAEPVGIPPRGPSPAPGGLAAPRELRRDMKHVLATLSGRVAECAATDASFLLQVETVEGGVHVVDAHLERRGEASDESVACARSALVGETVAARSATPGRKWSVSVAAGM